MSFQESVLGNKPIKSVFDLRYLQIKYLCEKTNHRLRAKVRFQEKQGYSFSPPHPDHYYYYPTGAGGASSGMKRTKREAPPSDEVKNV
jgi:hypothetical protein